MDLEGSTILFTSATSVLNNIREGIDINNIIEAGGNGDPPPPPTSRIL
jgi:hypothetical protein